MSNKLGRLFLRECSVLCVLFLAGLVWFALLNWLVPHGYEFISRHLTQNYSYLWNDAFQRIQDSAWWGPLLLGVFYGTLQVARFTGWLSRCVMFWRPKSSVKSELENSFGEGWTVGRVAGSCMTEIVIAVTIVLLGAVMLHFSHRAYERVRSEYFSEVVMTGERFRSLSPGERAKAQLQYEVMSPDVPVAGMFNDYGWRAKAPFYVQKLSLWLIIWGYPVLLLVRAIRWSVVRLHYEPS